LSRLEAELQETVSPEGPDGHAANAEGAAQPVDEELAFEEPEVEAPDVAQARSLLTEPRPAGFGEVLVTDAWLAPEPPEESEEEPPDRQQVWETRQELRQLNLLRERPLLSYDARYEQYWGQVCDAQQKATNAIIDPYTAFVISFADADIDGIAEHRAEARDYGRQADALLALGRAYVAIGRMKTARSVLQKAAKADPFHAQVWRHLGISHLFARANAAAVAALERAVDQAPGDFPSELALAVARYHKKDYRQAEEHLKRLAGESGLRATARSMLACSMRMQGKWDEARVELSFLRQARPGDWAAVSDQCLDCVARGEQKRSGALRARRRGRQMWRSLAAAAAGGVWVAYAVAKDLFEKKAQWATIPLFVLALVLVRGLRGISGGELPGEFGNAEQGLPCWQTTKWLRPRQSEF
jgi:tetratricopeptide (TPR) repeat protein